MEQYLLECLDSLSQSGDDKTRRLKRVQRISAWDLLNKEWRALVALAAKKESLPEINENTSDKIVNKSTNRNRKIGRRGGKGLRRSFEDNLAHPLEIIASNESNGYKLAVLIAQKTKMDKSWNLKWDDELEKLRIACEKGIHPVWSKLAKEANLFAELSRFKITQENIIRKDSSIWIENSYFDPEDTTQMKAWLDMNLPFNAKTEQLKVIQKIKKDMANKPRFSEWSKWMEPVLRNQHKEIALIEGMLLACSKHKDAISVLENISDKSTMDIAKKQVRLLKLRNGNMNNWEEDARIEGEDLLSAAIRTTAWKQIGNIDINLSIDDLRFGIMVLSESENTVPDSIAWKLAYELFEAGEIKQSHNAIKGIEIVNNEQLRTALRLNSEENMDNMINSSLDNLDDDGLLMVAKNLSCKNETRIEAAKRVLQSDTIRYMSDSLDIFTELADIENLSRILIENKSLAKVYPERVLLVWHMIYAKNTKNIITELSHLRENALASISESPEELILSDTSKALISLLDGIPDDVSIINEKLDSEGLLALNEVRRALSPEGDNMVRTKTIERLEGSIKIAKLTYLERKLFQSLTNSLLLNRVAMDIESGMPARILDANQILNLITDNDNISLQSIKFIIEMIVEHGQIIAEGINPLEKWYRKNNNNSLESKLVKATIQSAQSNHLEAAREYQEAARKVRDDFEQYALIMRKALISYAHGGGWSDSVNLINSKPALTASVTERFQLYLNVCNDELGNKKDKARNRLHEYAIKEVGTVVSDIKENRSAQIEVLELLMRYPEDLDPPLPKSPFQGRVMAAIRGLQRIDNTHRSELDLKFEQEMARDKKDIYEIQSIANQIADYAPIRGLRKLERAMSSSDLSEREKTILERVAGAMFVQHSTSIPIKERSSLRNLSLKPVIIVDTNILIDALKDDLLRELTGDSFGSLNWTVERSFHWMLRRRGKENLVLMNIPPMIKSEFMNRVKTPENVLKLFSKKIYIDSNKWNEKITKTLLDNKVKKICEEFGNWGCKVDKDKMKNIQLEDFMIQHRNIFDEITKQKMSRGDNSGRSIIKGLEIYPEGGDMQIIRYAAELCNNINPEIGKVIIATRDSDFKLISRSLEEEYGFGVVGDAQELNRRVLQKIS